MTTITIPTPVIGPGMYFKVRYRLLPAGPWINLPNQTNAPFTIGNVVPLSEGDYELEATLVIDDRECSPIIYPFHVATSCVCLNEVNLTMIAKDQTNSDIKITYTLPRIQPACGWIVMYRFAGSGTYTVIPYATLPAGGITIPSYRKAYDVIIKANCCNDNQKICFQGTIEAAGFDCLGGSYRVACEYYESAATTTAYRRLTVCITSLSTPAATQLTVFYRQTNLRPSTSTGQPDTGTVTINVVPGQSCYDILINANGSMTGQANQLTYEVLVTDTCGNHALTANGVYHPKSNESCVNFSSENTVIDVVKKLSDNKYYLRIQIYSTSQIQMPTLCANIGFYYGQIGVQAPWAGNPNPQPADTGTVTLSSTSFQLNPASPPNVLVAIVQINPSPDTGTFGIVYSGSIGGCCTTRFGFSLVSFGAATIP